MDFDDFDNTTFEEVVAFSDYVQAGLDSLPPNEVVLLNIDLGSFRILREPNRVSIRIYNPTTKTWWRTDLYQETPISTQQKNGSTSTVEQTPPTGLAGASREDLSGNKSNRESGQKE